VYNKSLIYTVGTIINIEEVYCKIKNWALGIPPIGLPCSRKLSFLSTRLSFFSYCSVPGHFANLNVCDMNDAGLV
jgi:hypothetical protein